MHEEGTGGAVTLTAAMLPNLYHIHHQEKKKEQIKNK